MAGLLRAGQNESLALVGLSSSIGSGAVALNNKLSSITQFVGHISQGKIYNWNSKATLLPTASCCRLQANSQPQVSSHLTLVITSSVRSPGPGQFGKLSDRTSFSSGGIWLYIRPRRQQYSLDGISFRTARGADCTALFSNLANGIYISYYLKVNIISYIVHI